MRVNEEPKERGQRAIGSASPSKEEFCAEGGDRRASREPPENCIKEASKETTSQHPCRALPLSHCPTPPPRPLLSIGPSASRLLFAALCVLLAPSHLRRACDVSIELHPTGSCTGLSACRGGRRGTSGCVSVPRRLPESAANTWSLVRFPVSTLPPRPVTWTNAPLFQVSRPSRGPAQSNHAQKPRRCTLTKGRPRGEARRHASHWSFSTGRGFVCFTDPSTRSSRNALYQIRRS